MYDTLFQYLAGLVRRHCSIPSFISNCLYNRRDLYSDDISEFVPL